MLYNVCCRNKCGNVHYSFNFIFLNPICDKTRNNTLLIFLYVLKSLDLSLTKLKKNQNIHSGRNSKSKDKPYK